MYTTVTRATGQFSLRGFLQVIPRQLVERFGPLGPGSGTEKSPDVLVPQVFSVAATASMNLPEFAQWLGATAFRSTWAYGTDRSLNGFIASAGQLPLGPAD